MSDPKFWTEYKARAVKRAAIAKRNRSSKRLNSKAPKDPISAGQEQCASFATAAEKAKTVDSTSRGLVEAQTARYKVSKTH